MNDDAREHLHEFLEELKEKIEDEINTIIEIQEGKR